MLWLVLSLLALAGGLLMLRRRRSYGTVEEEPWRASLREEDGGLDLDEIRRAEEEWLQESEWEDPPEPEGWR